jgi:hypothetical protein
MKTQENKPTEQTAFGSSVLLGLPVCVGCDPRWARLPISNVPIDAIKVRRRIRQNDIAKAYIKTATELQEWVLAPDGKSAECVTIRLAYLQSINAINRFRNSGIATNHPNAKRTGWLAAETTDGKS